MTLKEKDILDALKIALKLASNTSESRVTDNDFLQQGYRTDGGESSENCIYYLDDFRKNIQSFSKHCLEYKDAPGGELNKNRWGLVPMAALRSSAALTYNIFGDDSCCLINENKWHLCPGLYTLKYEWQSETINGHMANLDAHLHQGNCHLFVEMKMLEPLTRLHPFKTYQQYKDSDCPCEFKKAFDEFMKEKEPPLHFDAFQMLKHLLAIYNHFKNNKYEGRQKVVLLNCHWEPSKFYVDNHIYSNRTISLKETYEKFQDTADRFIAMQNGDINFRSLFDGIGVDLELATCDHRKLIQIVGKENDKYLKRYEIDESSNCFRFSRG